MASLPKMSTKRFLILALCVVVGVLLVLWRRESSRARDATGEKPSASVPSGPKEAAPPRRANVRKTTPALRAKLLAEIRAAHLARANASSRTQSNAGTPSNAGPQSNAGAATAETDDASEDSDRDYITSAMEGIVPMLMGCYREGLQRAPRLAGHVVITFTIEGATGVGGVISESTIDPDESDLADPDVQECMRNTIYALEVDPPTSGGIVRVTYPFTFTPPVE